MRLQRLSSSSCLGLGLLLLAQTASASWWDVLDGDLKAFQKSQQTDAEQQLLLQAEADREGKPDLFPEFPAVAKGTLEERREERTGEYVSVQTAGRNIVFHDVPLKEWYAPYVRVMAERGVVNGYYDAFGNPLGLFKPANNVSIEELAKIVVSMSGSVVTDCPATAKNLTASGSWSVPYVGCAEQRGYTVFSDGTVDVKRPALRAEVVMTVLQSYKKEPSEAKGTVFTDVQASIQFAAAIEQAYADGIVIGYTDAQGNALGTFGPSDPVTRAELVKILTIADQVYRKK